MLTEEPSMEKIMAILTQESREEGIEQGLEQGLERGLERGREEGFVTGREKTARNLIGMGMSINDIARATELSVERISALVSG